MLKVKLTLISYKIVTTLIAPLVIIFLLIKGKKPKYGKRIVELLGFVPKKDYKHPLWFHTVSVGETMGALPLIKEFAKTYPQLQILVTTTTTTACALYCKLPTNITHLFAPLDSVCAVQRFIKIVQPRGLVIMETELWPNLLTKLHSLHIPIMLINARLSDQSCIKYQKLGKFFTETVGKNITHISCQTHKDAQNFAQLGFNPKKLSVSGSLKFDVSINQPNTHDILPQNNIPVLVVASTHDGEEQQVLDIFKNIKKDIKNLVLIIIPRHPERFNSVYKLCLENGLSTTRRSQNNFSFNNTDVFLGDSMGELPLYFKFATVVLMGGSLVDIGGHNPLEAIACKRAVVSGPYVRNFKQIYTDLQQHNATIVCPTNKLEDVIKHILLNKNEREVLIKNASTFLTENKGATQKTMLHIKSIMNL